MSLKSRRQSILNLNPTVLQVKNGHPYLFNCYSPTSHHSYLLSITPFKGQDCLFGLRVHCLDKTEKMTECDGNCRVVCKHALAAILKRFSWQGLKVSLCEKLQDARRLLNLHKGGKLVEIQGVGKSVYGIVYEVTK